MAIERVVANGAVIGACGIALKVLSGKLAHDAGCHRVCHRDECGESSIEASPRRCRRSLRPRRCSWVDEKRVNDSFSEKGPLQPMRGRRQAEASRLSQRPAVCKPADRHLP
jgi:hypothetical protein